MPSLREQLGSPPKRQNVIRDACGVLDQEVAEKSGLMGLAIRGAYKVVQGVKPGFVPEVVDHLLDDFLDALDPIYQEALQRGAKPGAYLESNAGKMADALLSITDKRAETARRAAIKKAYEKLRPTARKHVEAAAPRVGRLLERHAAA
ncbi:MAG TPA: hypothetical protein VGJ84_18970 [Polyangiaceae bacterium]